MATKVSNPLTVVAIFSTLAEGFATISLINLPPEIQSIFVYFVMAFPILIVGIFFALLNWNHTVLYAPSDFEDEEMYLESLRLKEAVKQEVIGSLTTVVGDEVALSAEQVQRITEKVGGAVEQASMESRKDKILSLLVDGELSTQDVYERMNVSKVYVYRLLGELNADGRIVQRKEGRHAFWSLP
ncbi:MULTISPECIES: winged helix-turn-helix domain-containing protein [unclassified Pseudomonas]|uniref:winged helix-turn-helix domain-containing protein n=1 Tax=unclassified Pseudomonas TaxID=196821 RepID=UPI0033976FFE